MSSLDIAKAGSEILIELFCDVDRAMLTSGATDGDGHIAAVIGGKAG